MIIGNGQLAQAFSNCEYNGMCIFASGVPDSGCVDTVQFEREKNLLVKTLEENKGEHFVYFSSCALSASEYPKNAYYQHKQNMEELILLNSNNYYIFRIPQLFGHLKHHKTLINFLYECILNEEVFTLYSEAYRYVIEIEDVRKLVEAYLNYSEPNIIVNIANPYRYKVIEIVKIFEKLLDKKANYEIVEKEDGYLLDLSSLESFLIKNNIDIAFEEGYLFNKLEEKVKNYFNLDFGNE